MNKITKAVIAVAGYGTRFLPATKNVPKQMLSIRDTPIVHYIVKECIDAGIRDIIIVNQYGNTAIEDYFDSRIELEEHLRRQNSLKRLKKFREVFDKANIIYVRQHKSLPYGSATPLLVIKSLIGPDEAFAYLYGDDVTIYQKKPIIKRLMDFYNQNPQVDMVIAAEKVSRQDISKYAAISYKPNGIPGQVKELVEKPKPENAPSLLAMYGRFILTPKVIKITKSFLPKLNNQKLGLTSINNYLAKYGIVCAVETKNAWFDTGNPLSLLKATFEFVLHRPDLKDQYLEYIKKRINLS